MKFQVFTGKSVNRRQFIGGSDARIIMSPDDEAALIRLWKEKRGEAEPEDLSDNLVVQLGVATEALNRTWYERNTGRITNRQRSAPALAALYRNENDIRGRGPDERRDVRQARTRPLIADLEPWLRKKLGLISQKSKLAEAIRYALARWEGLTRFLDDGRDRDRTPTRSSARSDPSPLVARMRSSPAPTAAAKTGRSSPRWSKPASSTASILTSISPTRSPRSSTVISTARSTISCHGPT